MFTAIIASLVAAEDAATEGKKVITGMLITDSCVYPREAVRRCVNCR